MTISGFVRAVSAGTGCRDLDTGAVREFALADGDCMPVGIARGAHGPPGADDHLSRATCALVQSSHRRAGPRSANAIPDTGKRRTLHRDGERQIIFHAAR
jgi:hypothetical protein